MFREMRRIKQKLNKDEYENIIKEGTWGVLSVTGDDGYPYGVPINYYYENNKLYFHCAKSGHKLDAITKNDKASFCIVGRNEVVAEKYTTYYQSVIAFGRVKILDDSKKIMEMIEKFAIRFAPDDSEENRKKAIDDELNALCMLEMNIEHITGKECIELVKQKMQQQQ